MTTWDKRKGPCLPFAGRGREEEGRGGGARGGGVRGVEEERGQMKGRKAKGCFANPST